MDDNFNDGVRIDVLICTYRRRSLQETLKSVDAQIVPDNFVTKAIVADNDIVPSAQPLVESVARTMRTRVAYIHAPAQNISLARNACLDAADAEWVAFIDDDEVASPGWLAALYACAQEGAFDAVFGPALAQYGDDAPVWIRRRDYHSTWPQTRDGAVQTGHAGNVLLRWRGGPFQRERFLLEKGRTGGEDTEFFFRLWRNGARLGIAKNADVREAVEPARLSFRWISTRKFRAGQTYGRHAIASSGLEQFALAGAALAKVAGCTLMAGLASFSKTRQRYWALRGIFHWGVFTAQWGAKEQALYGN